MIGPDASVQFRRVVRLSLLGNFGPRPSSQPGHNARKWMGKLRMKTGDEYNPCLIHGGMQLILEGSFCVEESPFVFVLLA